MSVQRGEQFDLGSGHVNDRVLYEGKEYRVTGFDTTAKQVYLADDTDPAGGLQVHVHHLILSWCPRVHGGSGRPQAA